MIMDVFHYSKCLARTDVLILFMLTLSSIIVHLNAFSNNTPQIQYNKEMLTHAAATITNNNNSNRFGSIKQVLYHTPYIHQNETFRWHKINSSIFKYRVKRKTKTTFAKASQSREQILSQATKDERNNSTNIIDFSNNKQIHKILTFIDLHTLLNQRSINNNISDILVLNLSRNVIKQIDGNILKSLENVRRLDLSQNQIDVLNTSESNNKLQWLSVSQNQLVSFNGQNLTILKFLDLSCNNVANSSQIQINELNELEHFDLSGNQLNVIQRYVFEKSMKLKVVNLSYNRLGSINMDTFRDLVNVEGLDLSYNQISFIDNDSFSHLIKLQYLDLSHNRIDAFSLRAVQGIPNLIKLSIAFNTKLGDALQGFISSWSLKEFDMSGTGLCEIPNALAQSIHTLNVSNNNFAVIRCGDLDSYPLLQHLDISSCHISDIEDDALGRLDLLVSLHLNNNNLTHVPSSLPVYLMRLFLQNNQIAEIQASAFSHLVHLEVVNLSGNQIAYLPSLPLPRLLILDLRASRLKRLSESIIKMSPRLKVVFLDGNPIKCTELQEIAEWATPCRTDDFFEHIYSDDEPDSSQNYDDENSTNNFDIWPKQCKCKACQLSYEPIDIDKSHCNDKHLTILKRIRSNDTVRIPPNVIHPTEIKSTAESSTSTEKSPTNIETKKDIIAIEISKNTQIYENQNQINYGKLSNDQKSGRLNDTSLLIQHDIQSFSVNGNDEKTFKHVSTSTESQLIYTSETTVPTDYLETSNLTTEKDVKRWQFNNNNISTNYNRSSISGINDNTFMVKAMIAENERDENAVALHQNSINAQGNNQTEMRYERKDASIRYDKLENSGVKTSLTPKMPAQTHITVLIPEAITVASSREFTANYIETSSSSSSSSSSVGDDANIEINYEQEQLNRHPKYNDSDHKENKSKVNWNINKAISRTNDTASLEHERNLSISDFHRGNTPSTGTSSNRARDNVHINEINKNQLTERNQMNEKHRPNDTESHENMVEAPHEHNYEKKFSLNDRMDATKTTTKETSAQKTGKRPNEGIVYSNSFAENGMLINDRNNNDHQLENSNNNEIALLARKNEANEQKHEQRNSMQMQEENADIVKVKLSTVLSPILKGNQELDNGSGKTGSTNIIGHAFKADNFGFAKETVKTKTEANAVKTSNAIDNGNARNVNTTVDGRIHGSNSKQTQQINNMATFATQTNRTKQPLIGSLTQNVSIIDNEHQFERYSSVEHSMNEQKTTTTAKNTTTKLQSANDNVQAYIEDRYDNRKGSISDNSSAVYAVSEQWHDKCATSGNSGLFAVISIGICCVLVTFYLVYVYRCKNLYNRRRIETIEQNGPAQNHLIGIQMEMLSSKIRYTDTPIDLW